MPSPERLTRARAWSLHGRAATRGRRRRRVVARLAATRRASSCGRPRRDVAERRPRRSCSAATARCCAPCSRSSARGMPVFGVNFGRVGFLTTAEPRRARDGRAAARSPASYASSSSPTVRGPARGRGPRVAVNDVVVASDVQGRIARLGWKVNGVALGELACDGSSSHAGRLDRLRLSAGGPVLDWGVEAIGVTFVAPHTLTARPLVLPRGHARRGRQPRARADRALDPRRRAERSRAGARRVGRRRARRRSAPRSRCSPRSRSCSAIRDAFTR